jgi:site-specific DNA-methyltransferase (adenine-specific)
MNAAEQLNIKSVPIGEVLPYPGNPRINDRAVDPVAASIKEFGFQQPIVVDTNNVVIVGHTRLLAAKKLGLTEVPVVVATNLDDDQVKAYRLADNRTNQNAEWDWSLLGDELNVLLEEAPELVPITGFDQEEIKKATTYDTRGVRKFEPDAKPDPISSYGDHWVSLNGDHNVLCTENTSEQFKEFLKGKSIDAILTDPPYNISLASGKGSVHNDTFESDKSFTKFLNDCFKPAVKNLRVGGGVVTCGTHNCFVPNRDALEPLGVALKVEMMWVKSRITYSPGVLTQPFKKQHENLWYGSKAGGARYLNPTTEVAELLLDDRQDYDKMTKSELLDALRAIHENFSTVREADHEKDKWAVHPTVKPTALFVPLVRRTTMPGDTVCDIFAGTGVTALACEEVGRKSISVELDPSYVDCILARLYEHHQVDFTNQNGVKWSEVWEVEKARRAAEEEAAGEQP